MNAQGQPTSESAAPAIPRLAVILVNFGRVRDTVDCVRSLEASSYRDFEVIVVDNASTTPSFAALQAECPRARIVPSSINAGFAEGNNIALRLALEKGCQYLLLLNNDTLVDSRALSALIDTLERDRTIGVTGGKIVYAATPAVLWYAGGILSPGRGLARHRGMGEPDRGQYDHPGETPYVTGCCMMLRREVCETIGLLDRGFFAYFEDADYCLRAHNAGFRVWYEPRALIYHSISATAGWDSPVYLYLNLRNKLLFIRKHTSVFSALLHAPLLGWFYIRQFLRLFLKWRDIAGLRAAWWGMQDGLRGNSGEDGSGRLSSLDVHTQSRRRT